MTLDAKEQLTGNIWGNVEPLLLNTFQTIATNTEIIFGIHPQILKYCVHSLGFSPKH